MRQIIKIVEAIRKCAGSAGSRRSPPTPSSALTSHRIRKEALVAGTEGAKHSTNHSFAHRRRGLDDVDPAVKSLMCSGGSAYSATPILQDVSMSTLA